MNRNDIFQDPPPPQQGERDPSIVNPPGQQEHARPVVPSVPCPRGRGWKFTQAELVNLFTIMERILPIGPEEWEEVVSEHSQNFPGHNLDSLCHKYHSSHRKKIPTGDPNMPPEIRMAKQVKHQIGDRACLGGGAEEYDLETDQFCDVAEEDCELAVDANPNDDENNVSADDDVEEAPGAPVPVINKVRNEVGGGRNSTSSSSANISSNSSRVATPPNSTARNNGLGARGSGISSNRKPDFMELMAMQMNNEVAERVFERREQAEDRIQLLTLIGTLAAGYFGMKQREGKRKRKKSKSKSKK